MACARHARSERLLEELCVRVDIGDGRVHNGVADNRCQLLVRSRLA